MKITGDEWLSHFDTPAVPDGLRERVLRAAVKAASEAAQLSWIERLLASRLAWASAEAVAAGLLLANLMVFMSGRNADETVSPALAPGTMGENQDADIRRPWEQCGIWAPDVNGWFETGDHTGHPRLVDVIFDTLPLSADELDR